MRTRKIRAALAASFKRVSGVPRVPSHRSQIQDARLVALLGA